jgi:hypothetical protein
LEQKNILEKYKEHSKCIKQVEINKKRLKIIWPNDRTEIFLLKNLKKIAVITTDEGPLEPDIFWLLMFEFPIMIPSDDLILGSLEIANFLLDFPNFNYDKFIEAMSSTKNDAFQLWEKQEESKL